MVNISDIRRKEVINIRDGAKIGYVQDFEVDLDLGLVTALTVPKQGGIINIFGKNKDIIIEWESIVNIGIDAILIDVDIEY